jgi:hypothetical protein
VAYLGGRNLRAAQPPCGSTSADAMHRVFLPLLGRPANSMIARGGTIGKTN